MKILEQITAPQETVNEEFVTVTKIYYNNGDKVKNGDLLMDIETSKSTRSIYCTAGGYVRYFASDGDDVKVGQIMAEVYDSFDIDTAGCGKTPASLEVPDSGACAVTFSKTALELIKKENIDRNLFAGFDFVTLDDVKEMLEKLKG